MLERYVFQQTYKVGPHQLYCKWRYTSGNFRVSRGRRNTLEACQYQRAVFAWQAQHFLLMHFAFCDVAKAESKVVAGTAFCNVFENWRRHRKSHTFFTSVKMDL